MKSIFRLSAWLPAFIVLGASAQAHASDPADPSVQASLPVYRSAFDGYRRAPEPATPPAPQKATNHQDMHAGHGGMQHQHAEMPDGEMGHAMHMYSAHQHMEEESK